jgi:hypothetical protein
VIVMRIATVRKVGRRRGYWKNSWRLTLQARPVTGFVRAWELPLWFGAVVGPSYIAQVIVLRPITGELDDIVEGGLKVCGHSPAWRSEARPEADGWCALGRSRGRGGRRRPAEPVPRWPHRRVSDPSASRMAVLPNVVGADEDGIIAQTISAAVHRSS